MAAPNLIGATTINGKTSGTALSTTSATTVLNNPATSGKVLKVNTVNISNSGAGSANVSLNWNNGANLTGTSFGIAANITIPAGSTLNVVDKSSQYYLEENTSLGATAGVANYLTVTISYEDIS